MKKNNIATFSFIILCVSYLMMSVIKLSPSIVMPVFQQRFELSSLSVGLISSMFLISYATMQLLSGPICRKIGVFKVTSLGIFISIIGMLLFGFAKHPVMLFFGRFLQGIGLGPIYVGLVTFLQQNYTGSKFVRLTGIGVMSCSIGSALSGAPLSYLITNNEVSSSFIMIASFSLLLMICSIFLIPSSNRAIEKDSESAGEGVFSQIKDCFKLIFTNTSVLCGFLLWMLYNATQITYQGLWSAQWFRASFPGYERLAGFSSTIASIGLIISCPISDSLISKKLSRNKNLFIVGFVELVCIVSLIITKNLFFIKNAVIGVCISFLSDFLFGFFTGHLCVQISAVVKENAGSEKTATIMGILNFSGGMFSQLFQWLTGFFIDEFKPIWGSKTAFSLAFVFIAAVFSVGVIYSRRLNRN